MNHDRDRSHSVTATETALDLDAAPGRASRTGGLNGPTGPRASGLLMRKAARDDKNVAGDADVAVGAAATSTGSALPDDLRAKFEGSLGTDLSNVRVHTGGASHEAASAVGAKAYAVGNDVHFGAGHYDPSSAAGQHLLAHEVAHTVQQRGGSPTRQNKLEVSSAGDHLEHEADRAASAMVTGAAFSLGSAPTAIHRSEGGLEVGGGIAVSSESVKATVKGELTKTFKLGYVEIEGGGEYSVEATLSRKESEAGKAGEGDKLESHLAEACSNGSQELNKQVEAGIESKKGWLDAKLEAPEFEADTKGGGGLGVTLNLSFGGHVVPVKFTAIELAKGKREVLSVEVQVPISLKTTLWENPSAKLVASNTVTAKVKVQPNWGKIGSELSKQASERMAKKGAEKVVENTVDDEGKQLVEQMMERELAQFVEPAAFAAIAVSQLAAFYLEVKHLDNMKKAEQNVASATAGFTAGAMTALGVPFSGGDPTYFARGMSAYLARNLTTAQKAMQLPSVADAAAKGLVTLEDVHRVIQDKIKANTAAIHGSIHDAAQQRLSQQFAQEYYNEHQHDLFGDAKQDADEIAINSGKHSHGLETGDGSKTSD